MSRETLTDDRAEIVLVNGGEIVVERFPPKAVLTTPTPIDDAGLVHPYLAPICVAVSHWLLRETFHAGGFVLADGVWAVAGERSAGKSSTLAWLALAGYDVVCDDLLVVEAATVFAGPRAIDLREESARELDAGDRLGRVGERERWRLPLNDVAAELPLAGWVFLEWGDEIEVEVSEVRPPDRLRRVAAQRAIRALPPRPNVLLDLAALPAWTLRRPEGWGSLGSAVEKLLLVLER